MKYFLFLFAILWFFSINTPSYTHAAVSATYTGTVSQEDIKFYRDIKGSTSPYIVGKINIFVQKITNKTLWMTQSQKNAYYNAWLRKIDNTILALTGKYFQSVTLPSDVNAKYLILKLLRLEIDINLKNQMNIR